MTLIETILIRFGGYSHTTLTQSPPQDREPIVKLGLAVAFAALFACINWSTAAWSFSTGQPFELRVAVVIVAGLFGFGLVSVLDSSFLYFSDTSDATWVKKASYGVLRVSIVLLVSAITSQAVIPVLLRPELEAYALKMVEDAEQNRSKMLEVQFELNGKQTDLRLAGEEVEKLEEQSLTLPLDIKERLNAAKKCWAVYYRNKQDLIQSGYSIAEAKESLRGKAGVCARDEKNANTQRDDYFEDIRSRLIASRETKSQMTADYNGTKETIKSRVDSARKIEDRALSPQSATVLSSLIKSERGAMTKFFLVTLFFTTIECLPLILKMICGQTPPGEQTATDRKLSSKRIHTKMMEAEHERSISDAIIAASENACLKVLASAEGRTHFAKVFSAYMLAVAPAEAVNSMMREIERRQADVNDFSRRYPRYAGVIAEAWARAIRETTEILQGIARPV